MRWGMAVWAVAGAIWAGAALADPAVGVWKTEPDRRDLVSHIRIETCGAALCGRVLRAFDAGGQEVRTSNVGTRLFWDMQPEGAGNYGGGTVQLASMNMVAKATMRLRDDRLTVTGCKGPACYSQTWQRVARP